MQQLILDIHSDSDAVLIKDLLKKFKTVDVMSFSSPLPAEEVRDRINQGISDADAGRLKTWKSVKSKLTKKIQAQGK